MEHRYSNRLNVNLQVLLYKRGLPIMIGCIRNMSKHGVFVECAADGFSIHEPVEIEWFMRGLKLSRTQRCKFFITRKETCGLALSVFDHCELQHREDVEKLILKSMRSENNSGTRISDTETVYLSAAI